MTTSGLLQITVDVMRLVPTELLLYCGCSSWCRLWWNMGRGKRSRWLPPCPPLNSDFRTQSVFWLINLEIASHNIDLTTPYIRSLLDIHQSYQSYAMFESQALWHRIKAQLVHKGVSLYLILRDASQNPSHRIHLC